MPQTLTPAQLPHALEGRAGLTTLSLDCFDTLLWRDTHAPVHVFTTLSACTMAQRVHAEGMARQIACNEHGRSEVSLSEIYAQLLPNASQAQRTAAIAEELTAEATHCFAFGPTVELMQAAKTRGLAVIIASDTYLSAKELCALIAKAAGAEVAALIDRVFCSSEIGRSKTRGMLGDVLGKLKAEPAEVLHIGDNHVADYEAATKLGIGALHLEQFAPAAKKRLRLETSMGAMARHGSAATPHGAQPHRAALAISEPPSETAAHQLGLTALGPVFYGFEQWLQSEAAALDTRARWQGPLAVSDA